MSLALKQSPRTRSEKKTLSLFIAGIGAVGGTLIEQIKELEHPNFTL